MGSACCCCPETPELNFGEHLVRELLERLTPISLTMGIANISLDHATLENHDEDQVKMSFKAFQLYGVHMEGSLTCDVPMIGEKTGGIVVIVDIEKSLENWGATVAISDWRFASETDSNYSPFGCELPFGKSDIIDLIREPLASQLEEKINEKIQIEVQREAEIVEAEAAQEAEAQAAPEEEPPAE